MLIIFSYILSISIFPPEKIARLKGKVTSFGSDLHFSITFQSAFWAPRPGHNALNLLFLNSGENRISSLLAPITTPVKLANESSL